MRRLLPIAVLATLASGCFSDADFHARSAPELNPASQTTVSVLGVFKDGLMNADAWDTLGPALSPSLHSEKCDVLYGEAHVKKATPLAQSLEEYARDNGITDELFAALSPAATGDLVVVFTVAGRPQKAAPTAVGPLGPRALSRGPTPIRGSMSPAPRGSRAEKKQRGGLEVSASFFSRQTGHSVALLSMLYTGSSEEEGLALFAKRLSTFMPSATCVPWKAEGMPTPEQVRALGSSQ